MKPIKFFQTKKSNKLKLLVAIFFSVLMVASIFGVLVTNNNSLNNSIHADSSTNIPTGCTSSVSIPTSYFTDNSVSNSGTSTVYLPVYGNSSQASSDFSYEVGTSGTIHSSDFGIDSSGNLITSYYFDNSTIDPTFVIPAIYVCATDSSGVEIEGLSVGTVTVTITEPNGGSSSWSHTFNDNTIGSDSTNGWVIVTPSISFSNSDSGTFTISISETNDGCGSDNTNPTYSYNQGHFITDGSANGNSIVTSEPSQSSTDTMYGWHYGSTTATVTIPQYETSYDISWSSNSGTNPVYNSDSQTASSGTFTGSLTTNSITVNPVGDPDLVSGTSSTYSFSYYLSSQYQVSSTSTTQSTSASYSFIW